MPKMYLLLSFGFLLCTFIGQAISEDIFYSHEAWEIQQTISSPMNKVLNPFTGLDGYYYFYEYDVQYYLHTDPTAVIDLLLEFLDIPSDPNCSNDMLEIFAGKSTTDRLLWRRCTPTDNMTFTSSNEVLVRFFSNNDSNDYHFGFRMKFWKSGSFSSTGVPLRETRTKPNVVNKCSLDTNFSRDTFIIVCGLLGVFLLFTIASSIFFMRLWLKARKKLRSVSSEKPGNPI